MKVKVWGARGSVPAPGPEMNRYGGNTSCVELELSDGSTLIIDAGTGIRSLGVGHRQEAAEDQHPAHPPAPGPHPGPDVLRALLPLGVRDHDLGPLLARGLPRGADLALHLGPPLPRRGPRAALRGQLQGHPAHRVGARPGQDPRRGRHPSRADPRLPDHRRPHHPHLHLRPRARARSAAGVARAGVDLGLRPRPRHRPSDPRLPVHGRGVPGPRRLGSLAAHRHTHLRPPRRGSAALDVPSRSAALRRLPGPLPRDRAGALAGARRSRWRRRDGRRSPGARGRGARAGSPPPPRGAGAYRPRAARPRAGRRSRPACPPGWDGPRTSRSAAAPHP